MSSPRPIVTLSEAKSLCGEVKKDEILRLAPRDDKTSVTIEMSSPRQIVTLSVSEESKTSSQIPIPRYNMRVFACGVPSGGDIMKQVGAPTKKIDKKLFYLKP